MSNMRINSYPSVCRLGHRMVQDILVGSVVVQEKVDGSQFSFTKLINGEMFYRSKGVEIFRDSCPALFKMAVETAYSLRFKLRPGWIYRSEAVTSPKHNALKYNRIPNGGLILYDVQFDDNENYADPDELEIIGEELELEVVPLFYRGANVTLDYLQQCLSFTSVLGGQTIEGVVIKNYSLFTPDKKVAMAKLVRPDFKEINSKEWHKTNLPTKEFITGLSESLRTQARWLKSVQHLREANLLTNTRKDIGLLIKETKEDIVRECTEDIKDNLFNHFVNDILRSSTKGLPEWYTALLEEAKQ
ncbi:MAG: hypothetical protein LLF82_000292 [Dehalococcoides mccartyi]|uniref:RNA ligase family protein n=1 Tax=Dehalococcoides mccartyi TaxID=61435 RepID=UPI002432AE82|nr:RNA ligase family protein [Dehalococcoides mccartyi]MCF7634826.1 hypothetical protein [Dehalococcoides mccartyi]